MKARISLSLILYLVVGADLNVRAQKVLDLERFVNILKGEVYLTYLGIDFSAARFVGNSEDFPDGSFIKMYNPVWNTSIGKDMRSIHLLSQVLRIKEKMIGYRYDIAITHNNNLNFDRSISRRDLFQELSDNDIETILGSYELPNMKGVGLMIIIEKFDALSEIGLMHFTLFDLETRRQIYREKLAGKPFGHNPKRYWAESIHDVIFYLRSIRNKEWKKEYLK